MKKTYEQSKYSGKRKYLKTRAINPFNSYSDWSTQDGEIQITFSHIKHELYQAWESDCISVNHPNCNHSDDSINERINCDESERQVNADMFDSNNVKEPGIWISSKNYSEPGKIDEVYDIVLPYEFMSLKLCNNFMQEFNRRYGTDLKLALDPIQLLKVYNSDTQIGSSNRLFSAEGVDYPKVLSKIEGEGIELPRSVGLSLPTEEAKSYRKQFAEVLGGAVLIVE